MSQCLNLSFLNSFQLKPIDHESYAYRKEYRNQASYEHQHVLSNILNAILQSQQIRRQSVFEQDRSFRIKSKIWILKSPVGSGKTSTVLSALAKNRDPIIDNEMLINTFCLKSLQIYEENKMTTYETDLIIVPHTLYHQWLNELKEFPSIKSLTITIGFKSVARKEAKSKKLKGKIILIKDTMLSEFLHASDTQFLHFRSIYIDEPQSVKLKIQDLYKLKSKFNVLICATPEMLVYKMERILSHFFSYQSLKLRQMCIKSITIEIDNDFILNSINLEPFEYSKVICTPNTNINNLSKFIPSNIAFGLLGHDSNKFKLFQNEQSVIFSVLDMYNKKINQCTAREAYINANSSYQIERKQELLFEIKKKKEDLQQKTLNIDRIINDMSKSDCVVCFESMHESKAVLPTTM